MAGKIHILMSIIKSTREENFKANMSSDRMPNGHFYAFIKFTLLPLIVDKLRQNQSPSGGRPKG